MKGNMWIALAVALLTAVPGGVLASHLVTGNPETVVTGHTVLASNIFVVQDIPTDFAAIAGLAFAARRNECVVWFNGVVIFDGTLGPTGLDWDSSPDPPADADDDAQANDNALDPCGKIVQEFMIFAVEAGDCDPRDAVSSEFVRDLSFVDPNGQAHLVSEQTYTCFFGGLLNELAVIVEGELGQSLPGDIPDSPQSGDGDPLLSNGQTPGSLGLLNETFVEFVWVTTTHAVITDPTLDDGICLTPVVDTDGAAAGTENFCSYNFALVLDTCNDGPVNSTTQERSATNRCTDGGGEEFFQDDDDGDGNAADPGEEIGPRFDDSARALTAHVACPATHDEIRDGNSNRDGPGAAPGCEDNHREDKTADFPDTVDAPPGGPNETDYDDEEDHLTAQVDLYVSQENCLAPVTVVAQVYCANIAALTVLVVNHPGCWEPEEDAVIGDICWDPYQPPNDAAGVGGRDLIEGAYPL